MIMKLILIRHAKTVEGMKGIIKGQLDGTISNEGLKQIKEVALKLKKYKIDAIYSSDLMRARKTAEGIAKFHNVKIKYLSLLRERNFGSYQGKVVEKTRWQKIKAKWGLNGKPKGGESILDVKNRAERFLKILNRNHKDETVLVVSHRIFISILLSLIQREDLKKMLGIEIKHVEPIFVEL